MSRVGVQRPPACYSCEFDTRASSESRSRVQYVKLGPIVVCRLCLTEHRFRSVVQRTAALAGRLESGSLASDESACVGTPSRQLTMHGVLKAFHQTAFQLPRHAAMIAAWVSRSMDAYLTENERTLAPLLGFVAGVAENAGMDWPDGEILGQLLRDSIRRLKIVHMLHLLVYVMWNRTASLLSPEILETIADTCTRSLQSKTTFLAYQFAREHCRGVAESTESISNEGVLASLTGATFQLSDSSSTDFPTLQICIGAQDCCLLDLSEVPKEHSLIDGISLPADLQVLQTWASAVPSSEFSAEHEWKTAVQAMAWYGELRPLVNECISQHEQKTSAAGVRSSVAFGMEEVLLGDALLDSYYRARGSTDNANVLYPPIHVKTVCELDLLFKDAMRQRRNSSVTHPRDKIPSTRILRACDSQCVSAIWKHWMATHSRKTSAYELERMRMLQVCAVYDLANPSNDASDS